MTKSGRERNGESTKHPQRDVREKMMRRKSPSNSKEEYLQKQDRNSVDPNFGNEDLSFY